MIKIIKNVVVGILCLQGGVVLGQPDAELAAMKTKYPNNSKVVLFTKNEVNISLQKGKLSATERHSEEEMLLNSTAIQDSKSSVEFNSFISVSDLKASTWVPAEKKYKEIKVAKFTERDVLDGAVFHQDTKAYDFFYPSLQVGAKKSEEYQLVFHEPRFLGSFTLSNFFPCEKYELVITADKDIELGFKFFNVDTNKVRLIIKEEKGRKIYSVTALNVAARSYYSDAPNYKYYLPHLIYYIKSYKTGGETKKILSGPADLYAWYYSLIKKMDQGDLKNLKQIADSLVQGKKTELEKVKAIYYWVQDKIRYVAFEDGLGGFVPRGASYVCDKRFGDCKDMANLIVTMLKSVNIPAYHTWIGTNDIPYRYNDVPTPAVDNHMIATYISPSKQYYFLDGTSYWCKFGFPSEFIQGKEALIGIDSNNFEIKEVPIMSADSSVLSQKITAKISGDKLVGKSEMSLSGYYKMHYYSTWKRFTGEDSADFYNSLLLLGSNKFFYKNLVQKNERNKDKKWVINYDYEIVDYVYNTDNSLFVNMNLIKFILDSKLEDQRTVDVKKDFYGLCRVELELEIPAGYHVEYLPPSDRYDYDKFSFEISYSQKGNKVYQKSVLKEQMLILPQSDFAKWNTLAKKLKKNYNESIILKKN